VSEETIGTATMKPDRTLVLQLRASGPGGAVGDGLFEYTPSHPQYAEVLKHVGPITPGQSKPVKPWS
jgi:hypothetical protein